MEELRERLSEEDIKGEFSLEEFLISHKASVFTALIGLIFLFIGVLVIFNQGKSEDKIEIIPAQEGKGTTTDNILVDIEGAVVKPGVYELSLSSRIEDLLIAAGGLSQEADRDWAEKSLNRAQKLVDGAKIYIPQKGESLQPQKAHNGILNTQKGLVNINTASASELDVLWGIGPVTAQKIIESRPYQQVSDLLTKKILKTNVYQRIENQLTVY